MIRTAVNYFIAKAFQRTAYQTAVERARQILLEKRHIANDGTTRMIDTKTFLIFVAILVKNVDETRSLKVSEIEVDHNLLKTKSPATKQKCRTNSR